MADKNEEELRNAAINLVSMLRSAISSSTSTSNTQGGEAVNPSSAQDTRADRCRQSIANAAAQAGSSGSSVQQNMARCFPGLFKDKKSSRGSLLKKRTAAKKTAVQFFLLQSFCERTPKPSQELTLLHAGLGRRTVNIPEDAGHAEITDILCEAYPKMAQLEGAWMLYKAFGGSGQRRLNVVSPEEEGYKGASLVRAWAGKGCLYIMPIQQTLDDSPLPLSATEFQAMPKARCLTCKDYVPIQLLCLHAKSCISSEAVHDEISLDDNNDVISLDSDDAAASAETQSVRESEASASVHPLSFDRNVSCPLCCELFTEEDICAHASVCGESIQNDECCAMKSTSQDFNSISEIVKALQDKIDNTRTFSINVTRQDLFQRGLKQWGRQKQASPKNAISVAFIGEHGIDQGALRKEFFTEMIHGIQTHFFEGDEECGKSPKYSICDFQDNNFKTCGEIFAASIVQGGPAPNFMSKQCYQFLCFEKVEKEISPNLVTDSDLKSLIHEVESAEEERLLELTDQVVACGYTGPINLDHKTKIINAISLHSFVRIIPMLTQLREGLKLYGLDDILQKHQNMCEQLFIPGYLKKVDADFLLRALSPEFSEDGSVRRQKEIKIINFLQDFLQELEDNEDCHTEGSSTEESPLPAGLGKNPLSVPRFLQWATGQAHIPLIQSEKEAFKIIITFEHDCDTRYGQHTICYPTVNACSAAITFPTQHYVTYSDFEKNILQAICGGYEFSRY